ncbi:Zinc finger protein [Lachnellula subtilissima]|uniref:Zinc finger protein n=1 Tax=Lachnellula subtilissima TaxID=602034 RepID=A0A8H8RFE3_9HELO|nr:Zinc finger protein [Lachnellula subtilissima]
MTDVRSLLKNERAARRIQHKYASYTPTGTLLCVVCHLQLKSESLWEGHLRSAGHIMRFQKLQDKEQQQTPEPVAATEGNKKKRKASEDGEETIRKRTKPTNGLPEDFFDPGAEGEPELQPANEIQIPSRPATPAKATPTPPQQTVAEVNEDEWAAFEADIAAAEIPAAEDAIISAPAMSAAQLAAQSMEETKTQRKERQEAELEGDKEDAARKMEDQFDEMQGLEQRVRKMREKREALRAKESMVELKAVATNSQLLDEGESEDEDEDEGEGDDFHGFMMKR